MTNKNAPILVTGGSGYIASWIVQQLLEDGYTVHATVRDKSKTEKVDHILELQKKFHGKLILFEADLLKDGSFSTAMEGCELVIHTASPFKLKIKDAQKELVDPALKGTRNVLLQATKTPTVKRVVLTSSVVAIYGDAIDMQQTTNNSFTENYWNTSSSVKHQPYAYSKTVAEREAWAIHKSQNQWDLTVINPGFVLGPSLSKRTDGESTAFIMQMLSGERKAGVPYLEFGCVDVRDVAKAHILAGMTPSASGRHIACQGSYTMLEIANLLKKNTGEKYQLPTKQLPKFLLYLVGPFNGLSWGFISKNIGHPLKFNNSYSKKDLGLVYRDFATTLKDQTAQLEENGLV